MMEEVNKEEFQPNRKKLKKLYTKIRKQMEFYFSDSNLVKDKFLSDLISKDPNGYVDLEIFKKFNKMRTLTNSCEVIASSVARSNMFELSEDHKKVRRITPIELSKDFDACTLYVEKLPQYADQKWVKDVLGHIGCIKYVNVPRYKASHKIKGFAFVEFESPEDVKKACEFYKVLSEKECSSSENENKTLKNAKKHKHGENVHGKRNKKGRLRSVSESSDKLTDFSSLKSNQPEDSEKNREHVKDHSPQKGKRKRKRENSTSEMATKKCKECDNKVPKIPSECDPESKTVQSHKKSEDILVEPSKEVINDNSVHGISTEYDDEPKAVKSHSKCESMSVEQSEEITTDNENMTEVKNNHKNETKLEESKTKRKRKNTKKHRSNTEKPVLRVMPKSEWKVYRNKYLDLQRSTMSLLKKQIMLETQELKEQEANLKPVEVSEPKKSLQFLPGVIIKVKLKDPVKSSSEIKNQVKTHAVVAYIDASDGCHEIFLRCHNSDEAKTIIKDEKLSNLGRAELLQDDEEKKYWEKIETDRKNKFENPIPHKKRGREKLLAKAAKLEEMKNKHIYFDE